MWGHVMAYRFKLDEKIRDGFHRIARDQIERAGADLSGPSELEHAVHETRKCLKRLRALLRLMRPGLSEKSFERENAALRDIAALLSETRDNHVLLLSITNLGAQKPDTPLMNLKRLAVAQNGVHPAEEDPGRTAAALAGLRATQTRFDKLKIEPANFSTLRHGMERTYGHARRAMNAAYKTGECEAFHELRKYIQQHWRHAQLLERAWPELMQAHAAAARELSQILGDDHDLAVLAGFLERAPKGEIGKMEARHIRKSIRERQGALRELARPRLQRLFADKPDEMGRRLESWWKASKRLKRETGPDPVPVASTSAAAPAPTPIAATEPRAGRAA